MPVSGVFAGSFRRWGSLLALLLLGSLSSGCRQDMHDQPVLEPYEASDVFSDRSGNRPLPEGTVARGQLRSDSAFYTGTTVDGSMVTEIPIEIDYETLIRGRERFATFCAPCHGRTGEGRGMIVRRGFQQPSSFHEERLRTQPPGYFYTVISNGFGEMSSYASQIPPHDRWAVVAYIKTLQWSRNVPLNALTEELRQRLESELAIPSESGSAGEKGQG